MATDSRLLQAGGRAGALARYHGHDDPRTIEAKREVLFVRADTALTELSQAEPTDEMRAHLLDLLAGAR